MSGEERGDDLDKAKDKAQDKAKDKSKTRMASLPRPDELDIQAAGSSSDRLQSVATSSEQAEQLQNIPRTGAGPTTLRLEQLQLQQQQQYQQNQNIRSGWQFQKMHCAVISILMIVLMLTLLDVWMAYLDSSTPTRRDHESGAETWTRTRDLRNLTAGERNLTGES